MSTAREQVVKVHTDVTDLKRFLKTNYDLTRQQAAFLLAVAETPNAKIGFYAASLGLGCPMLTDMLDRMESHGLITRERSVVDRRAITPVLTAQGEELVNRIKADEFVA